MMTVKEGIVEVVPGRPPPSGEVLRQCSSHDVHADHSVSWQSRGQALLQASSKSGGLRPRHRQDGTIRPTTSSGKLNITQMASRLFTPDPQSELLLNTTHELQRPARQWKVSHSLETGQGRTSDRLLLVPPPPPTLLLVSAGEKEVDSIPKASRVRLRNEVLWSRLIRPLLHDGGQEDQADQVDKMFSVGHWIWHSSSYGG